MLIADKFTRIFRQEHRLIRDSLLELIQAFQKREQKQVKCLIERIAIYVGPHFRYKEEALYPYLVKIFGKDYIEQLLENNDCAIAITIKIKKIANKDFFTDEDVKVAINLVRQILPQISDSDGLSIMVERLPEAEVQSILDMRDRSLKAGLDLWEWSEQLRFRPALAV